MGTVLTEPWDAATYGEVREEMASLLNTALETDDRSLIAATLGHVARIKGMRKVAEDSGLGRESLYKALLVNGNPELTTVLKVVHVLGLRLHVRVVPEATDE